MKKSITQFTYTIFCCFFLFLLLFYSKDCILLSSNGLLIWYRNMIPSLFPFMVLSGFMVRSNLSSTLGHWIQPILGIFFKLPSHMLYTIFMGFLCGFPMGAKIVADLLEEGQISLKEGEYLLAFSNNIGPLYMLGYVIPLFQYESTLKTLAFMYFIPFVYGLFLLYFTKKSEYVSKKKYSSVNMVCCQLTNTPKFSKNYLIFFQQALFSAIEQITLLGGCMIFFNCIQIFPKKLASTLANFQIFNHVDFMESIFCSFIEIGGGLDLLSSSIHNSSFSFDSLYLTLSLLTFGGLSCMIQTYFIIKNTGLKISTYIKHKAIQSCIFILLFLLQNIV